VRNDVPPVSLGSSQSSFGPETATMPVPDGPMGVRTVRWSILF